MQILEELKIPIQLKKSILIISSLILLYLSSNLFGRFNLLVDILLVLIVSIPMILYSLLWLTTKKVQKLHIFKKNGILYSIFSKRILSTLLIVTWFPIFNWMFLLDLKLFNSFEWGILLLFSFLLSVLFILVKTNTKSEIKSFASDVYSFKISVLFMVVFVYFVLMVSSFLIFPPEQNDSFQHILKMEENKIQDVGDSYLIRELAGLIVLKRAWILYMQQTFSDFSFIFLAFIDVFPYIHFFLYLFAFLIDFKEFKRIFLPVDINQDLNTKIPFSKIVTTSFMVTIFVLFIYIPFVYYAESFLSEKSKSLGIDSSNKKGIFYPILKDVSLKIIEVEKYGTVYVKPGTYEEIEKVKHEYLSKFSKEAKRKLNKELDVSFSKLKDNVDPFLDWYYSLFGEYARIAKLLSGNGEEYIRKKCEEYLIKNDPFKNLEQAFREVDDEFALIKNEYQQEVNKIIERNKLNLDNSDSFKMGIKIIKEITDKDIFTLEYPEEIITFKNRMLGSGMGAGVSAIVVYIIVQKIVSKGTFKLASIALKQVLKKGTSKTVSAVIGGTVGGAVGAIGGPIGVAVGATVGAVVGISVGVVIDKVFLEIDEKINREDFKKDIIEAIDEVYYQYKKYLS